MGNGWKITALIFIILFIVENLLFAYLFYLGIDIINKEETCKGLCSTKQSDSFYLDGNICSCYLNGKFIHSEEVK